MKLTNISFSIVALASLMIVTTGCANDSLKHACNDLLTGAKIGATTALLMRGSGVATEIAGNKLKLQPQVAAASGCLVAAAGGLVLVKNVDKIVPAQDKKTSLQSNALQAVATFIILYGTDCALVQVANYFGLNK